MVADLNVNIDAVKNLKILSSDEESDADEPEHELYKQPPIYQQNTKVAKVDKSIQVEPVKEQAKPEENYEDKIDKYDLIPE